MASRQTEYSKTSHGRTRLSKNLKASGKWCTNDMGEKSRREASAKRGRSVSLRDIFGAITWVLRQETTKKLVYVLFCASVLTGAAVHTGVYYTPVTDVFVYCVVYCGWATLCLPWLVQHMDGKVLIFILSVLLRLFAADVAVLAWSAIRGHHNILHRGLRIRAVFEPSLSWLAEAGYNLRYGVVVAAVVASFISFLVDRYVRYTGQSSDTKEADATSAMYGAKGNRRPNVKVRDVGTGENYAVLPRYREGYCQVDESSDLFRRTFQDVGCSTSFGAIVPPVASPVRKGLFDVDERSGQSDDVAREAGTIAGEFEIGQGSSRGRDGTKEQGKIARASTAIPTVVPGHAGNFSRERRNASAIPTTGVTFQSGNLEGGDYGKTAFGAGFIGQERNRKLRARPSIMREKPMEMTQNAKEDNYRGVAFTDCVRGFDDRCTSPDRKCLTFTERKDEPSAGDVGGVGLGCGGSSGTSKLGSVEVDILTESMRQLSQLRESILKLQ